MKTNLLQRILLPLERAGTSFMGAGAFSGIAENDLKELLSIVRFDYMGSSDFELGTIPRCLKIISENERYAFHQRSIKDIMFYIIAPDNFIDEYVYLIERWSAVNSCVEYHGLMDIMMKGKNEYQIQGWLDIQDNILFFINEDMATKMKNFLKIKEEKEYNEK